ncbi:MAG: phosphoenolpyruvate-utilizing N-terminal domain-containing protein, partial [Alphaproteobacteria bacterium]
MSAALSEQIFAGSSASSGLAFGHIRLQLPVAATAVTPQGTPAEGRRALKAAVAVAHTRLSELVEVSDPMAGEILTVQVALLEDPELTEPVLAAIAGGEPAMTAWRAAMDEQIAGYRESDNAYFRARATDMADLRDRVADALANTTAVMPPPQSDAILVAEDLPPSRFLETDWSCYRGAVLTQGSAASHVAMLARARGIPLLIGLDAGPTALIDGAEAILDAEGGCLIQHPAAATLARYDQRLERLQADATADSAFLNGPAATVDGTRVQVCLNADDPATLEAID